MLIIIITYIELHKKGHLILSDLFNKLRLKFCHQDPFDNIYV